MGPKRKSDRKYEKCKCYDRGFFKNGSKCSKDHPDMFVKIQTALMKTAKANPCKYENIWLESTRKYIPISQMSPNLVQSGRSPGIIFSKKGTNPFAFFQ